MQGACRAGEFLPGAREVAICPQLQAAWTVAVAASTGLAPLVLAYVVYPNHDEVLEPEWCLWLVAHLLDLVKCIGTFANGGWTVS